MVTYAKISLKMVNPRDVAGNTEEKEEVWPNSFLSIYIYILIMKLSYHIKQVLVLF